MKGKAIRIGIEKYRQLCNKLGYEFDSSVFTDSYEETYEFNNTSWTEMTNAEMLIIIKQNNKGKKTLRKFYRLESNLLYKLYMKYGFDVVFNVEFK